MTNIKIALLTLAVTIAGTSLAQAGVIVIHRSAGL